MAHDTKHGTWFLERWEVKFKDFIMPHLPLWVTSSRLTFMTIIWCFGIVLSGFFARNNLNWFWLSSILIAFQWVTDTLDGSVGRYRNAGLIKWGFYMDHLLDYFFLSSIVLSYLFTLPQIYWIYSFFVLIIFGGFMANSFLYFGATGKMRISHHGFGPTEMRLVFILVNALVIFLNPILLAPFLPWVLIVSFLSLIYIIYNDHKEIWKLDMDIKNSKLNEK